MEFPQYPRIVNAFIILILQRKKLRLRGPGLIDRQEEAWREMRDRRGRKRGAECLKR